MTKRASAKAETRRRIVEATAKLHGERGVLGTTWKDIAEHADVSVATVYSHFPSLRELLPACGELVMERVRPPRPEAAAEVIGNARGARERLERVAAELFGFYERGGPHIEVDVRERELPGMREWEEFQRATVSALVRAALEGRGREPTVQLISALFDLGTYKALRTRGVGQKRATEKVVQMAVCLLEDSGASPRETPMRTETLDPLSVPADAGEARWWFGSLAVIKATAAQTGGKMTIVEVTEPPGAEAPLHVHHHEDEGFWVLEGDVTFEVGDATIEAGPATSPSALATSPTATRSARRAAGCSSSSPRGASRSS